MNRVASEARQSDQQPFRCVKCGEAVSHIRRNDCRCVRDAKRCPVGARVREVGGSKLETGVVIERFHDPEQARVAWGTGSKHTHNVSDLETV